MKAILINVEKGEVSSVDYNGDFRTISKWIGGRCHLFTTVSGLYDNNDILYVDDNGLNNGTINGFIHKNYESPLMGNALLLGMDISSGDSVDVETPLDSVQNDIYKYTAMVGGKLYSFKDKPHPFLISVKDKHPFW